MGRLSQGPGSRSARAVQEEMLGTGERNINSVALGAGVGERASVGRVRD